MKAYTMRVDATFSFCVHADTPDAAKAEALKMFSQRDPVDCGKFRLMYEDPFISVAGADLGYPSLEAHLDEWLTAEEERAERDVGVTTRE